MLQMKSIKRSVKNCRLFGGNTYNIIDGYITLIICSNIYIYIYDLINHCFIKKIMTFKIFALVLLTTFKEDRNQVHVHIFLSTMWFLFPFGF